MAIGALQMVWVINRPGRSWLTKGVVECKFLKGTAPLSKPTVVSTFP